MTYKIKDGYIHRESVSHFDDTPFKDQFQKEVYKAAYAEAFEKKYNSVLDVGCGSGYKLVRMFNGFYTLGLEVEPTLSWLKTNYPLHKWEDSRAFFEECLEFPCDIPHFDIVICADVIEHVEHPDKFLENLAILSFNKLFLSTPERDLVRGKDHFGPPQNETHFREWNEEEFVSFVSEYFTVVSSQVVSNKNGTLMLVLEPKAYGEGVIQPEIKKEESDIEADSSQKKKGGRPKKK